MSNIIGEGFKEYVAKQVNLRQEVHGKKNRTRKELLYLNSRTSWIKLASGVSVEQSRLNLIPGITNSTRYVDQGLAKNFILFNGTQNSNKKAKSGIVGNLSNPAYGMLFNEGDTKNFGIVPMPGIESVDVKTLEKGSIKRATVKIKAYNKTQFDVIDVLYLRLGYTLLLEWGDSHYLDNNSLSDPITKFQNTILSNRWFDSTSLNKTSKVSTNQFKMLEVIEKEREKYSGCYDALFGRIVNFKWTFESDGSYSITLDIISLGDVIESLKMNIPAMIPPTEEEKKKEEIITSYQPRPKNNILEEWVDSLRKASDPNYYSYNSQQGDTETRGGVTGLPKYNTRFDRQIVPTSRNEFKYRLIFDNADEDGDGSIGKDEEREEITIGGANKGPDKEETADGKFAGIILPKGLIKKTKLNNITNQGTTKDYLLMNFQPAEYQYFVRLGTFLELLQNFIFPHYNKEKDNPAVRIDSKVEGNLMYYAPNMTSLDPRVCIINSTVERTSDKYGKKFNVPLKVYPEIEPFINTSKHDENSYGNVMNIYMNFFYLQEKFKQVDKKGNLVLAELLREMCKDINKSLGGVNSLEPKIDSDSNTYIIYDRNRLPGIEKLIAGSVNYDFELFGYNLTETPNTSNFVHNAGITTEITNDYAIMTTIGATAQNNIVGEDATSFSKWNEGIIDRFKRNSVTGNNKVNFDLPPGRVIETPLNYYYELISQGTINESQNEFSILGLNRQYEDFESSFNNFLLRNNFKRTYSQTLQKTADGEEVKGGRIDVTDKKRPFLISPELISSNLSIVPNYYKEIFNLAYKNKKLPSGQGGFMPFNLNLELDGISGIKIYSKLKVQNRFLPSNYPQTIEFITTDITHTLSNNKWVTKINTIGMPLKSISTKDLKEYLFTYEAIPTPDFTPDTRDTSKSQDINLNNEQLQREIEKRELQELIDKVDMSKFDPQLQSNEEIFKNKQQEIRNINGEIKQLGGSTQFNPNPGGPYNNINPELKDAREYLESLKRSKPLFKDQL